MTKERLAFANVMWRLSGSMRLFNAALLMILQKLAELRFRPF
jgi:hypothetical protein